MEKLLHSSYGLVVSFRPKAQNIETSDNSNLLSKLIDLFGKFGKQMTWDWRRLQAKVILGY